MFLILKPIPECELSCRSLPGENREFLGCTWPWRRSHSRHAEHSEGTLTITLGYTRSEDQSVMDRCRPERAADYASRLGGTFSGWRCVDPEAAVVVVKAVVMNIMITTKV
jgi:hypothetical protein